MNVLKHKLLLALTLCITTFGVATPVVLADTAPVDKPAPASCPAGQTQVKSENNNAPDTYACCPKSAVRTVNGDKVANGTDCLIKKYVTPTVQMLSVVVGLAVTASIIFGAIQYSSSEGDPGKAQAAKVRIRNSIVAFIAFIFLIAMLNFIVPGGL